MGGADKDESRRCGLHGWVCRAHPVGGRVLGISEPVNPPSSMFPASPHQSEIATFDCHV